MSFHTWTSTDSAGEDRCVGCGVVTSIILSMLVVVVDRSPLPIFCPGPVESAHHFGGNEKAVVCLNCGYTVTDGTMPNEMVWDCVPV